jgi:hypothetical protein
VSLMLIRQYEEDPMVRYRRPLLPFILALAASVGVTSTASAATVSGTYAIRGYEYYATTTQGRFAGTATGDTGDSATWRAIVDHTPLTTTAEITGGYADLLTSRLVAMRGTFSGGSVVLVSEEAGCGTQTYDVHGTFKKVSRSDSRRMGSGTFSATLTHYRVSVLGSCQTYAAEVRGTISLAF